MFTLAYTFGGSGSHNLTDQIPGESGVNMGAEAGTGRHTVIVKNTGAAAIYLGGSDVSSANGMPVEPGQEFRITLSGRHLFAYGNLNDELRAMFVWG